MGLFNQKTKIKPAPQTIRVEEVVAPPKNKPRFASSLAPSLQNGKSKKSSSSSSRHSPLPQAVHRTKNASPDPSSSDEKRIERKRKAVVSTPRDSPTFGADSDSDDGDDGDPFSDRHKRARHNGSRPVDLNRRLRHKKGFGEDRRQPAIIHAADIASIKTKCVPVVGAEEAEVAVELQYPSSCRPERYFAQHLLYKLTSSPILIVPI
jgi:[histone H3]-lysine79 N-trimethyltransferase